MPSAEPEVEPNRFRAWAKSLVRIAVSAGLLAIVLSRVKADQLGALLGQTGWALWTIGLALVLLAPVAAARRSQLLLRGLGHPVSIRSVLAVNLEAMFFALVVPGELVGGFVRWQRVSGHTQDRPGAFTLVVAERLIDWVVLAAVASAFAHLLFHGPVASQMRILTTLAAGAIVLGGCAIAVAGRTGRLLRAVRARRARSGARLATWMGHVERPLAAGGELSADAREVASVLGWTVCYLAVGLGGSAVMACAVFPEMPVLPYIASTAVLAVLAQLPISLAGLGVRELSLPVLLGAYGVDEELGLLLGLSAFVPYLCFGAAGLAIRTTGRARLEHAPPRPAGPA